MSQETPEGAVAPDANASPEVVAPEGVKSKGSEAESSPAADPKPQKDGRDIRIDELTRRLREAERRNDRLLKVYEERAAARPEPAQPKAAPEARKALKDFNYDEAAYEAYLEERISKVADKVVETKLTEKQQKDAAAKRDANYFSKASKFSETAEDYYDVAGSAPITETIVELVKELDDSPLVAYHLGKNHELAQELSGLSERAAAIRLGKLEVQLVAERAKLKAKPVSQAPEPPPKLDAADPGNITKDPSQMTDSEFSKWFRKQRKR